MGFKKPVGQTMNTIIEFQERGFTFVNSKMSKPDERGIDGVMLLKKKHAAKNGTNGAKYYASAHYRASNMWGDPIAIPQEFVK
jgi:hypothetical protein